MKGQFLKIATSRFSLIRISLLAILLIMVLVVGYLSFTHKGNSSFDEMNTLRIAARQLHEIELLLNQEQNYPPYYFVIHFLLRFGNGALLLVNFLQFSSLLLCVTFFFLSARSLLKNVNFSLVLTIAFITTPVFLQQSTNIRMYAIMMFLNIFLVWLLLKYFEYERESLFICAAVIQCIISMLHPVGIFTIGSLIIPFLFTKFSKRKLFLVFVTTLSAGLISLMFFLAKANIIYSYFSVGTHYIKTISRSVMEMGAFFYFYSLFLNINFSFVLLPLIFGTLASIVILVRKISAKLTGTSLLLLTICLQFLILPIILGGRINQHHLTVFIPGVFLAVGTTLFELKTLSKLDIKVTFFISTIIFLVSLGLISVHSTYAQFFLDLVPIFIVTFVVMSALTYKEQFLKKYFSPVLLCLLFTVFFLYLFLLTRVKDDTALYCKYLQNNILTDTIIIAPHSSINDIYDCLRSYDNIIMYDEYFSMEPLKGVPAFTIMMKQAERGGSFPSEYEFHQMFDKVSLPKDFEPKKVLVNYKGQILCKKSTEKIALLGYKQVACYQDVNIIEFSKH